MTSPSKYPWLSNYVPQNVWQGVSAGASIAASAQPSNHSWHNNLTNATSLSTAAMDAIKLPSPQCSVLDVKRTNGLYGSIPVGYNTFTGIESIISSVNKPVTTLNELFLKNNSVMNNIPNLFSTEKDDTDDRHV